MPQIKEILLDCDNTLVLSEDLAFEALAGLVNEINGKYNVKTDYTGPQLMTEFVGQNFRGVLKGMESKHGYTLSEDTREEYVKMEEDRVIAKIKEAGQPCVGANEALAKIYAEDKYKMAVVSSSALRRVQVSIEKVDQAKYFKPEHVYSAATSLNPPTSKPDPAIYLHAAKEIGVDPKQCIAVEDSKSGTLSAVRAGIWTIAYTGSYHDPSKAHEMAKTLMDLGAVVHMEHWDQFQDCIKKIEAM